MALRDSELEQWAALRQSDSFAKVFGRRLDIVPSSELSLAISGTVAGDSSDGREPCRAPAAS